MGVGVATFLLLYSSITFTVCEGKIMFPLLLFGSSVLSWPCKILIQLFILLKRGIICTFLIHSSGLKKIHRKVNGQDIHRTVGKGGGYLFKGAF